MLKLMNKETKLMIFVLLFFVCLLFMSIGFLFLVGFESGFEPSSNPSDSTLIYPIVLLG